VSSACVAAGCLELDKPAPVTNQWTRDYSLVPILPNETKEKRVLWIYGIYTRGSQAAIEYLTNPERMSELRKALQNLSPRPQDSTALLSATADDHSRDAVPGKSSLVALRIIPI
jgi:hypothetical protein